MKNKAHLLGLFLLVLSHLSYSQETITDTTALPYLQKAEFSVFGAGVGYELPLSKVLSLDTGLGFSTGAQVVKEQLKFQKSLLNPAFYLKTELKYYYNRYVRIAKKLPTRNGEGSYFAFQNKFLSQRLFDAKANLSNVMMYEVHWGIQRNLYENFLFNFHVGIGRAHDFTTRGSSNYTALGLKVTYVFAAKKVTRSSFDKFKF